MLQQLNRINLWCRIGLGFVFFYHGLAPKILRLSPIEQELVDLHNSGIPATLLSPAAGVMEILLAFVIVFFRRALWPIYASAALLVALLVDVAIVKPVLLVEAFNPVTINLASILLCYIIFLTHGYRDATTRAIRSEKLSRANS